MYLDYFALKRHPFRITPDPTLFCPGGGRGEILEALTYAISSGEGIVKVVGEVGSGKTMLCRILEERLPKSVEIVYLANPKLSPHDILYAIAFELKLPVPPGSERLLVMQHLQAYLLGQHAANRSVVVFVEEAQGMPLETLEEIRLLSNLETHRHKLLQIVLFGQPELEKNLRQRDIRQLRERITHSFHLSPLTRAETGEYLRFRLQAAGCGKSGIFSSGAERLIAKVSRGLIRRINILADKAMLAAYADSAVKSGAGSGRAMVQARHVRAAVRDSEFRLPFFRSPWFAAGGVISLLVALALLGVGNRSAWRGGGALWGMINGPTLPPAAMVLPEAPSVTALESMPGKVSPEKEAAEFSEQGDDLPVPGAGAVSATPSPSPSSPPFLTGSPLGPFLPEAVPAVSPVAQAQGSTAAPAELPAPDPPRQDVVARNDTNLMEQRRKAGGQWLRKVEPTSYTIQLMAVEMDSEEDVERLLRQVHPVSLLDRIYVCRMAQGERQRWVIVYDDFPGVTSARKAIETLPPELRRFQPFVRRIDETLRAGNMVSL